MRLVFSGMVRLGDGVRVSSSEMNGAIHIGNDDVIDCVAEEKFGDDVTVTLNGEVVANGHLVTQIGYGYSEYTPVETDKIDVGNCDLIDQLYGLENQAVVLVIEDTPPLNKMLCALRAVRDYGLKGEIPTDKVLRCVDEAIRYCENYMEG